MSVQIMTSSTAGGFPQMFKLSNKCCCTCGFYTEVCKCETMLSNLPAIYCLVSSVIDRLGAMCIKDISVDLYLMWTYILCVFI